jgi:hypothetical protein
MSTYTLWEYPWPFAARLKKKAADSGRHHDILLSIEIVFCTRERERFL